MPATAVFAVFAVLLLAAVYRLRGLTYALAAVLVLGVLYAAFVVLATNSMG